MPPKKSSNKGTLYILDNDTGEYKKLCDSVESLSTFNPEEPEVVRDIHLSRDFECTLTLKNPVVADVEYKEITE